MKATFEFDLSENQREYEVFNQAQKMQSLLWDFTQQLRSWRKYGHTFKDAGDTLEKITTDFYGLVHHHGVNIDL